MEASRQRFACANPEKSEKTQRRMRDILVEEEQKLDFERHKSHPFPKALLVFTLFIIFYRNIYFYALLLIRMRIFQSNSTRLRF